MDVDDVIAHHLSRLEEHKRFLDCSGTSGPSTSQELTSPNANRNLMQHILFAADRSTSSPNPATPFMDDMLYQDQSPAVMNQLKLLGNKNSLLKKNGTQKETRSLQEGHVKADHMHTPHVLSARQALGRAHTVTTRCTPSRAVREHGTQRASPRPSSANFYGFTGIQERLAEEDRIFDEQLRASRRYRSELNPDTMYLKSRMWLEGRERSRQELVEERMRGAVEECPFRPQCDNSESRLRRSRSARGAARLHRDPSVAAHLERLEEARHQRAEAERRLAGASGSGWKNEPTVPNEFVFCRKVASIPALRKPISAPSARRAGERAEEREAMQSAPHSLEDNEVTNGTHAPRNRERAEENTFTLREVAALRERAHASAAKEKYQQEIITHLKKEIAEKDLQLEKQLGEMEVLRRELEVVKATVRRLTLQDAPQFVKETLVEMV